jgi:hypothetical protein
MTFKCVFHFICMSPDYTAGGGSTATAQYTRKGQQDTTPASAAGRILIAVTRLFQRCSEVIKSCIGY